MVCQRNTGTLMICVFSPVFLIAQPFCCVQGRLAFCLVTWLVQSGPVSVHHQQLLSMVSPTVTYHLTIIHWGWLFGDPVEISRLLCIRSYTMRFPVPMVFKLILFVNCLIICITHAKLLVDLFFLHIFVHVLWQCGRQTGSFRLSVIFVCDHLMDMCSGQISHKSFW